MKTEKEEIEIYVRLFFFGLGIIVGVIISLLIYKLML